MSLTVRKIPFDLSIAIRDETIDRLTADFGGAMVFVLMAANVWSEWGEMAIVYLRKKYDTLGEAVDDLKEVCLAIAQSHGTPLEEHEVDAVLSPMLTAFRTRIERFDIWAFQESRRSFIRAWDEVREPRFRTNCERLIPA